MGDLVQLFRDGPPPVDEPWEPYVVLSEEIQDAIVEVSYDIEQLWTAGSQEEFVTLMASIKERVAGWPSG